MSRGWVRCQMGGFSLEVGWEVAPGQALVLFGPSGAGKTLTLRSIAGLLQPIEGYIEIGGDGVFDAARGLMVPPHRRRVGYVPQEHHLFPHLTVAGNITYGLHQWARGEATKRLQELVATFRLEGLEQRRVWELSGGQQQRAALARALAPRPRLLLLDEPFSALDIELRRSLRSELRLMLRTWDIPIILVTHDREETLALGDQVQVMDEGRVVSRGEPLKVLGQPTQARVASLVGVENLLPMTVAALHPLEGTMLCSAGPVPLEVPLVDVPEGVPVTIGLRASDVILARERPTGLSARNVLPGTVVAVDTHSPGYSVTVECGALPQDEADLHPAGIGETHQLLVRCHLTAGAVKELGIRPEAKVWVVIKASSCFVVADDAAPASAIGN